MSLVGTFSSKHICCPLSAPDRLPQLNPAKFMQKQLVLAEKNRPKKDGFFNCRAYH
jgi:hypothetical protein